MHKSSFVREALIESYLIDRVEKTYGGITAKMAIPGRRGWPDRLVILPGGKIVLAELKRPKRGQFSAVQQAMALRLERLGVTVVRFRTMEEIDAFLSATCDRSDAPIHTLTDEQGRARGPFVFWPAGNSEEVD